MKKTLLILFVLLLGTAALAVWRWQAVRGPRAEAAAQRWICPMRCLNKVYDHGGKCPVCHMDLQPLAQPAVSAPAPRAGFSAHGHGRPSGAAPKPLGYRCPLRYSTQRFDGPGRCPYCTLPLKPYYAPGEEPQKALSQRSPWPELGGKSAVYFRPYRVSRAAIDGILRLAGRVSADRRRLLAPLPVGEVVPPKGSLAMLSAAGGGRPLLCSVEGTQGGQVSLRASRRLEDFEQATVEVRLAGASALSVPVEAVRESEGRAWVFRQNGESFEPVTVALGRRGERLIEVKQGLAEGDVVAGSGVFWVEAQWRLDHPERSL